MFGHDYFGSQDFLERLHGTICGWQDLRAKRRAAHTRHATPASGPPPATMRSAPVSGGAPAAAPPPGGGPVLVCFHAVQGRLVPVFGNPAEFAGATGQAGETHQAPPAATAAPWSQAAQAAPPSPPAPAPASAEPQEHPAKVPSTTIEPPDFSVQAVASASARNAQPTRQASSERPAAGTALNLSPPTPPSLTRSDEQAAAVERVLAQHRTEMEAAEARHAAALRDVLAEHRHSLADLLAQHREALREQARAGADEAQVFAQLRELLAEQARVMKDEHDQNTGANADLAELISNLGETVNGLAVAVAERKAPPFSPPRRAHAPGDAASVPASTASSAPLAPPASIAAPSPPPTSSQPEPAIQESARPLSVVRIAPTPPTPARSATAHATPVTASSLSSPTTPRACATSVTASLVSVFSTAPPATASTSQTRHQRRMEEEARQREHVHACIADIDDDDGELEKPHA